MDSCNSHRKLHIIHLVEADVDSILQLASQQEPSSSVLYKLLIQDTEPLQDTLTESAFAKQSISILQSCSLPSAFGEIILQ